MKKSLLALAVMGAFAGAAQAQVTLYGLIDTGIVSIDDGEERTTGLESGIGGAARWGIRGSEDLGGGVKGHFVLESGFDSDSGDGNGNVFSRLSYVGLDGGFGTLRLGRQDTAMKDATGKIDPFGAAGFANMHDFFLGGMDQRRANQLTYLTPNIGGLNGGVYYNFGEVRGESTAQQVIGLRVGYDNGPIHVQLSHENLGDIDATDATPVTDNDQKDTLLGAAYNFNVATLHAAYGQRSRDVGGDVRSGMLGVSAPLGSGKVMANFTRVDNRDIPNADSDVIALGYNYSLSKRTALVARYVRVENDAGASLWTDPDAPIFGETSNGFGVGVQHRF